MGVFVGLLYKDLAMKRLGEDFGFPRVRFAPREWKLTVGEDGVSVHNLFACACTAGRVSKHKAGATVHQDANRVTRTKRKHA